MKNKLFDKHLNVKGLRFNTWLIFTLFASGILVVLWFLQLNLITPYYRVAKVGLVRSVANNLEIMVVNDQPLSSVYQISRDNSLCIQLVDEFGHTSTFNGIGSGCYFEANYSKDENVFDLDEMKSNILLSEDLEYNYLIDTPEEMIVYGKIINAHLGRYYLLINAPITPEKGGLELIQTQFVYLVVAVLIFATISSIIISKVISKPFVYMTKNARKLASRNFDIDFDVKSFNIDEFNQLANALNYATSELKKVDQLRLDLIANVSHDIKTPITMILAYSEMIEDFSKDNEKLLLEHLDVINHEAKYLNKLVENLLELSMIESGNMVLNYQKFNLNELVNEIINLFKDVEIDTEFDGSYLVEGDRIRLGQVIYNFVANAINHAKASKIRVKLTLDNEFVEVSVIDNGLGIKKADLEYIWDRYYRIDKNFTRDIKSSGLGLSIVKGIIIAHNGEYGVVSEIDRGSKFYFKIKFLDVFKSKK